MSKLDYFIMLAPLFISLFCGIYSGRHVRSIVDFMAGGRAAGRYLLCMAKSQMGCGAVMFIGLFEVFSKSGFVTNWWQQISVPVSLLIAISGFVIYRYRQTRSLTLAQFFETRYSRKVRFFAGCLGFLAGVLNFGIIPIIGSQFFIYFFNIAQSLDVLGFKVPTFLIFTAGSLSISTLMIICGGQITVLVTNGLQSIMAHVGFLIIVCSLLMTFNLSDMYHAIAAQPPGKSMLNPFDSFKTTDFNLWWVLMAVSFYAYGTMAWQNSHAFNSSGVTPHETRMGNMMGAWPVLSQGLLATILAACAITYLSSPQYAVGASHINQALHQISDPATAKQMRIPITMFQFLPVGLKGLVCGIILMGVISGDAIHLHSWGSIFVQDIIMPLRKVPMSMKEHLKLLRLSACGVALFAFLFGCLFRQTEYIFMWFQVTTAVYVAGAGALIIGGLYWDRGTTQGAWACLSVGASVSLLGIIARQFNVGFLLNGTEISFVAALLAAMTYVIVSLWTCRKRCDMDLLLHRKNGVVHSSINYKIHAIIGINEDFSFWDKVLTYVMFWYSIGTFGIFIIGSSLYLLFPWSEQVWAQYWMISAILIPLSVTTFTTVWLSLGCLKDLKEFLGRLKVEKIDLMDDGRG